LTTRPPEEAKLYEFIGKRVADARRQARPRMSQAKLADQVKLSRTSIVNIESGRHRIQIHVLYEIARALGVDPRQFLPALQAEVPPNPLPKGLEEQLEKELGKVGPKERAQVAALVNPKPRSPGRR
jgi:transcriptional regulator with XRE-family HTH domain